MAGPEDLLVGRAQYLVQLLSGAHPGDLDGDVDADLAARQSDHALGQIDDLDRHAHLQHEDLAPMREDGRLEHQLHGLFHTHEEARHAWIGHGDWATLGDLATEGGDDAAPAAQDVPEAHRAVGGTGRRMGQDGLLGQPLRCAHDARGVYGLVRRDLHETAGADGAGCVHHVHGSEHVGLGCLEWMLLEDGDVLVGRGVVDDLGAVLLERLEHGFAIEYVDERLFAGTGDAGRGVVQVGLVVIEKDQLGWAETGNLATDLGADRPPGSGDEHPTAFDGATNRLEVGGDRRPSEQVLDLGLPRLTQGGEVVGLVEHVLHSGEHLHRHPGQLGCPQCAFHEFWGG